MTKLLPCTICRKNEKVIRKGFYRRSCDSKYVQKFFCKRCGENFSQQTYRDTYRLRLGRVIPQIYKKVASAVSQREISRIVGVSRGTVAQRIDLLARRSARIHSKFVPCLRQAKEIFFDELVTLEITKCLPLSLAMAVTRERFILFAGVSRIPAFGHLAKISRKKYGFRPDESDLVIRTLFENLRQILRDVELVHTDKKQTYEDYVREYFPGAHHRTYKADRAKIAGYGELKKREFDPLFAINHTFAMNRDRISNLKRKTWTTTKKPENLLKLVSIYAHSHNFRIAEELGVQKVPTIFRSMGRQPVAATLEILKS